MLPPSLPLVPPEALESPACNPGFRGGTPLPSDAPSGVCCAAVARGCDPRGSPRVPSGASPPITLTAGALVSWSTGGALALDAAPRRPAPRWRLGLWRITIAKHCGMLPPWLCACDASGEPAPLGPPGPSTGAALLAPGAPGVLGASDALEAPAARAAACPACGAAPPLRLQWRAQGDACDGLLAGRSPTPRPATLCVLAFAIRALRLTCGSLSCNVSCTQLIHCDSLRVVLASGLICRRGSFVLRHPLSSPCSAHPDVVPWWPIPPHGYRPRPCPPSRDGLASSLSPVRWRRRRPAWAGRPLAWASGPAPAAHSSTPTPVRGAPP
eukprot:15454390-Alexandrium_andersonii.AAC.2